MLTFGQEIDRNDIHKVCILFIWTVSKYIQFLKLKESISNVLFSSIDVKAVPYFGQKKDKNSFVVLKNIKNL